MQSIKENKPIILTGDADTALSAMKNAGAVLTCYTKSLLHPSTFLRRLLAPTAVYQQEYDLKAQLCHMHDEAGCPFVTQRRIYKDIDFYKKELLKASKTATLSILGLGGSIAAIKYGAALPGLDTVGFLGSLYSVGVGGTKAYQEMARAKDARQTIEASFQERYDKAKKHNFQTAYSPVLQEAYKQG